MGAVVEKCGMDGPYPFMAVSAQAPDRPERRARDPELPDLCSCGKSWRHMGACQGARFPKRAAPRPYPRSAKKLGRGVDFADLAGVELARLRERREEVLGQQDYLAQELRTLDLAIAPLQLYIEGVRRTLSLPAPESTRGDPPPPPELREGAVEKSSAAPPEPPAPRSLDAGRSATSVLVGPAPQTIMGVPREEWDAMWTEERDRVIRYGWGARDTLTQIWHDCRAQEGPDISSPKMVGHRVQQLGLGPRSMR